jgi:hypothetical protein
MLSLRCQRPRFSRTRGTSASMVTSTAVTGRRPGFGGTSKPPKAGTAVRRDGDLLPGQCRARDS